MQVVYASGQCPWVMSMGNVGGSWTWVMHVGNARS